MKIDIEINGCRIRLKISRSSWKLQNNWWLRNLGVLLGPSPVLLFLETMPQEKSAFSNRPCVFEMPSERLLVIASSQFWVEFSPEILNFVGRTFSRNLTQQLGDGGRRSTKGGDSVKLTSIWNLCGFPQFVKNWIGQPIEIFRLKYSKLYVESAPQMPFRLKLP